jgi:hypothetical protein
MAGSDSNTNDTAETKTGRRGASGSDERANAGTERENRTIKKSRERRTNGTADI